MKNLSTSIIFIVLFGTVIIMSAAATTTPNEKPELIGGSDSGIVVANLDSQEINKENLLNKRNIEIPAKPHDSAEITKSNQVQASFPDMPILILLGIGLFSIATLRRRAYIR